MTNAKPPIWLQALRVFWACFLALLLVFSLVMAAWGSLREALMLRVIDDRHAKSFLLQAPLESRVWVGDEFLGAARLHELGEGEDEDYDLKVEGLSVMLPRVYMREEQLLKQAVRRLPEDGLGSLVEKLAPGSTLLWSDREYAGAGFLSLLLLRDGLLDYAVLCAFDYPRGLDEPTPAAFLLRLEQGGSRVFRVEREEVWSDRIWAPEGEFWARRDEYDGLPDLLTGQIKTVWRWYFAVESDAGRWLREIAPEYASRPWVDLPPP